MQLPDRAGNSKSQLDQRMKDAGLQVVGAPEVKAAKTLIDKIPLLVAKEQTLIKDLIGNGRATFALDSVGIALLAAMNIQADSQSLIQIRDKKAINPHQDVDHKGALIPAQTFGTVTPDTKLEIFYGPDGSIKQIEAQVRIALIGRYVNKNGQSDPNGRYLLIPQTVQPWSNEELLKPQKRPIALPEARMYLAGANQMATVGKHDGNSIGPDPQHLITAMAESNIGTLGYKLIAEVPEGLKSHAGDKLEEDRRLLREVSVQDIQSITNPDSIPSDLVWKPITHTEILKAKIIIGQEPEPMQVRYHVVLDRDSDLLDLNTLVNGKIVPAKLNVPDALQQYQYLGFASLVGKGQNAVDNFARSIGEANKAGRDATFRRGR